MNPMEAQDHADPIAIVGMAGRFPGAPDADSLWSLLAEGRDAVRPVPADRWDASAQLDPEREIQAVGGFLDGVDLFDAGFFGVSPREAAAIDPQQRLLLEVGWQALEDAGQPASGLAGTRTGVYVGASWHDYELLRDHRAARPTPHSLVGNALDVIAARLSYSFGLRGPSMTVETGCSSSLVALHLAAQALHQGDVDAAIVGGTNLMLDPHVTVGLTHFGGLSPDGRCAAFSSGANGFVRGEGVAALYVKTLRRALADGDHVHGLVVRTVVNNDGGGDSLVTPSPEGQVDLLRRAYADGVVPEGAPAYIEAHGTGTGRGDPIEATAIGEVLGRGREGNPLLLGSVKTNIGHLEAGAGMAGLFKLLLAMRHRALPPSLHSAELNPAIPFEKLNLRVTRELTPLPAEGPLHMGVNSFGWGGTNAHCVVASPPGPTPTAAEARTGTAPVHLLTRRRTPTGLPTVVPLSAKQAPVLAERAAALDPYVPEDAPHIQEGPHVPEGERAGLIAIAGELAHRQEHFPVRAAVVAQQAAELRTGLESIAADPEGESDTAGVTTGRATARGRTAFVFPGQGSQWSGMGRELYRDSPLFAEVVDRCAEALRPHTDWDLTRVFAGEADDTWTTRIDMLQPTLWAMSLGLAELWRASGVEPDVVLGHSQGEITAATLAGILTYEDAALVMARRSAIARKTSGHGRMLAVDLDRDAALAALEGFEESVSLAVHNGPHSCVLSGDKDDVLLLQELLEADGVYCRLVKVDYASHSPQMDGLRDELLTALAPARPRAGDIALMSTVHPGLQDGTRMDAAYWTENLRRPVRFAESMTALFDEGVTHVVEISPHPVLTPALEQLAAERSETPAVLHTLRRGRGAPADVSLALARGYVAGLAPFGELPTAHTTRLPGHPLHRESYWTPRRPGTTGTSHGFEPPLLPAPDAAGTWRGPLGLSVADLPWLADHEVYGTAVLPGAAMLTLAVNTARARDTAPARNAARARAGSAPGEAARPASLCLENVDFRKEIALGETPARLSVEWCDHEEGPEAGGTGDFRLHFLAEGADTWETSMTARTAARSAPDRAEAQLPGWHTEAEAAAAQEFYRDCERRGLGYGAAFQGVRRLHVRPSGDEALGEIVLGDRLRAGNRPHVLHPALWDGAMQVSLPLHDGPRAVVPTSVRSVRLLDDPAEPVTALWSHAVRQPDGLVDLRLYDTAHRPLLVMEGLELRALPDAADAGPDSERLHHLAWQDLTAADEAGAAGEDAGRPDSADRAARPETGPTEEADTAAPASRWVVCGPSGDRAAALADALTEAGSPVTLLDTAGWERPGTAAAAFAAAEPPDGVAFVAPSTEDSAEERRGLLALAETVRACTGLAVPPRLAVVTEMAQPVVADDVPDPSAALYWGFTRSVRREHGELEARLVDTDATEPGWAADSAAQLLHGGEDQVALRAGRLYAARLTRGNPEEAAGEVLPAPRTPRQPFRLVLSGQGHTTEARCLPLTRREPGPGEVEIAVTVGALDDATPAPADGISGAGCAGRITAVGTGVSRLRIGDRVAACVPDAALASHATVRADHVQHVPDELTDTEGAVLPLPMAAAWHMLTGPGQFEPGETVLIHAAAGGLGHAALGIARALGARVLVTEDSEERREHLRDQGLTDVLDSRDPAWPEQVRAATAGRGVDLVLNSLAGAAVARGLSVLAPGGRLIEAAARSPREGRQIGLDAFGDGAALVTVDPHGLPRRSPERFARALAAVWELIAAAKLEAPPVCSYTFEQAAEALREHTEGTRTDRICLIDPGSVQQVRAEPLPAGRFRTDGSYLITGGLGALGLSLAEYLAENGAGTLVLTSRSAPAPAALERMAALRERGAAVHTVSCDVSDPAELRAAFDTIRSELPPLRGVVHAAGVLDDSTVRNLTEEQLVNVLTPKTAGARQLDAATADDPLDFFVLFSSAAALVGNAGQAAYAAANAYLDALAETRRRCGLPALSVQWGPFSDAGLAAGDERRGARLADQGMGGFPTHEAWPALTRMLAREAPVAAYVPISPRQWFDAYPETAALGSWQRLRAEVDNPAAAQGGEFLTRLLETPPQERPALVEGRIRELSGRVLRLPPERVEQETPFKALGLDSLMSLELRNRLESAFGIRLSPTLLWAYGNPKALAAHLCEQLPAAAGAKDATG